MTTKKMICGCDIDQKYEIMPWFKWVFNKNLTAAGIPDIISDVEQKTIYDKM